MGWRGQAALLFSCQAGFGSDTGCKNPHLNIARRLNPPPPPTFFLARRLLSPLPPLHRIGTANCPPPPLLPPPSLLQGRLLLPPYPTNPPPPTQPLPVPCLRPASAPTWAARSSSTSSASTRVCGPPAPSSSAPFARSNYTRASRQRCGLLQDCHPPAPGISLLSEVTPRLSFPPPAHGFSFRAKGERRLASPFLEHVRFLFLITCVFYSSARALSFPQHVGFLFVRHLGSLSHQHVGFLLENMAGIPRPLVPPTSSPHPPSTPGMAPSPLNHGATPFALRPPFVPFSGGGRLAPPLRIQDRESGTGPRRHRKPGRPHP